MKSFKEERNKHLEEFFKKHQIIISDVKQDFSVVHVSGPEYNKLRRKSIDEVKRTNGAIDILKAVEDAANGSQSEDEM